MSDAPRLARGSSRWRGLLAGLAVTVEYTVAVVGLVLWLLVLARPPRAAALAYVAGVAVGVVPLAAYNLWAFGSVTHFSYDDVVGFEGQNEGLFGISRPRRRLGPPPLAARAARDDARRRGGGVGALASAAVGAARGRRRRVSLQRRLLPALRR